MAFTRLSISLLLSGLILSAGMPAQAAPETVMVSEVTAMALEGKWPADWSYQGENGPDHWGELHPSYSKCARGRVQSPVDLGKATMRSRRSTVRVAFHPIRYEIFNDGRGIRAVPLEPQHPIRIDRHDYTLKHIVFRAPSEHTFKGRHYPLEAQLVYEADDGALAVLATGSARGIPIRHWTRSRGSRWPRGSGACWTSPWAPVCCCPAGCRTCG